MLDAVATTEPHDERRRPHRLSHRFVLKDKETLRALVDAVIGTLSKVIEGWF